MVLPSRSVVRFYNKRRKSRNNRNKLIGSGVSDSVKLTHSTWESTGARVSTFLRAHHSARRA